MCDLFNIEAWELLPFLHLKQILELVWKVLKVSSLRYCLSVFWCTLYEISHSHRTIKNDLFSIVTMHFNLSRAITKTPDLNIKK